jgi:hypothetical protein
VDEEPSTVSATSVMTVPAFLAATSGGRRARASAPSLLACLAIGTWDSQDGLDELLVASRGQEGPEILEPHTYFPSTALANIGSAAGTPAAPGRAGSLNAG